MCCRTQLAPVRQVGQVGETSSTSLGTPWSALKSENKVALRSACSRSRSRVAAPSVWLEASVGAVEEPPPQPLRIRLSASAASVSAPRISARPPPGGGGQSRMRAAPGAGGEREQDEECGREHEAEAEPAGERLHAGAVAGGDADDRIVGQRRAGAELKPRPEVGQVAAGEQEQQAGDERGNPVGDTEDERSQPPPVLPGEASG